MDCDCLYINITVHPFIILIAVQTRSRKHWSKHRTRNQFVFDRQSRLKLIGSKRSDRFTAKYVMDEATNLENSSQLVRDWQNISESSLAEIWLNEEEDEAWQDL